MPTEDPKSILERAKLNGEFGGTSNLIEWGNNKFNPSAPVATKETREVVPINGAQSVWVAAVTQLDFVSAKHDNWSSPRTMSAHVPTLIR